MCVPRIGFHKHPPKKGWLHAGLWWGWVWVVLQVLAPWLWLLPDLVRCQVDSSSSEKDFWKIPRPGVEMFPCHWRVIWCYLKAPSSHLKKTYSWAWIRNSVWSNLWRASLSLGGLWSTLGLGLLTPTTGNTGNQDASYSSTSISNIPSSASTDWGNANTWWNICTSMQHMCRLQHNSISWKS